MAPPWTRGSEAYATAPDPSIRPDAAIAPDPSGATEGSRVMVPGSNRAVSLATGSRGRDTVAAGAPSAADVSETAVIEDQPSSAACGTYSVNTSATLCPPKPNALLSTAIGPSAPARGASGVAFVATEIVTSSSRSSRLMVGGATRSASALTLATDSI